MPRQRHVAKTMTLQRFGWVRDLFQIIFFLQGWKSKLTQITGTKIIFKPKKMQTYIVYTGNNKNDETSSLIHYKNLLRQVAGDRLLFFLSKSPLPSTNLASLLLIFYFFTNVYNDGLRVYCNLDNLLLKIVLNMFNSHYKIMSF